MELSPIENNARRSRRKRLSGGTEGGGEGRSGSDRIEGAREGKEEWSRTGVHQGGCILWGAANSVPLRSITTSGVITELPTAR